MSSETGKYTSPVATAICMAVAATLLWTPSISYAEDSTLELPSYQLQRFRPAPGPADYVTIWGTGVQPHLEWNVGAYLNYARNPMQLGAYERPGQRTVTHQGQMDLVGSIGLFDMLEVGLAIPWTMRQQSGNLGPLLAPGSSGDGEIRSTALNDLRLTTKYQLLSLAESPVGVAFVGGASLPLATKNALASDGGFGAEAHVVAEYVFFETIRGAANLGFRYRPGSHQIQAKILGNEVMWGLGVHSPFLTDNLDVVAELAGAVAVEPRPERLKGINAGEVPIEARGALRYGIHPDWSIEGGMGAGLGSGVGAPDWRTFVGISGKWSTGGWWQVNYRSPEFGADFDPCEERYRDQTGRRLRFDPADCPELEEEDDGRSDEDVTAMLDDDGDDTPIHRPPRRALEEEPEEQEDKDSEGDATFRHGAIFITERVSFQTASADIHEQSYGLLNDVAALLERNPEIRVVRIEGHTDNRGAAQMNLELSEDRANSVRYYLMDAGIDADRIEAVGFGESTPIADNNTEEGRSENRRVEFTIVEME